jgi:hypothetical protein
MLNITNYECASEAQITAGLKTKRRENAGKSYRLVFAWKLT